MSFLDWVGFATYVLVVFAAATGAKVLTVLFNRVTLELDKSNTPIHDDEFLGD